MQPKNLQKIANSSKPYSVELIIIILKMWLTQPIVQRLNYHRKSKIACCKNAKWKKIKKGKESEKIVLTKYN